MTPSPSGSFGREWGERRSTPIAQFVILRYSEGPLVPFEAAVQIHDVFVM